MEEVAWGKKSTGIICRTGWGYEEIMQNVLMLTSPLGKAGKMLCVASWNSVLPLCSSSGCRVCLHSFGAVRAQAMCGTSEFPSEGPLPLWEPVILSEALFKHLRETCRLEQLVQICS